MPESYTMHEARKFMQALPPTPKPFSRSWVGSLGFDPHARDLDMATTTTNPFALYLKQRFAEGPPPQPLRKSAHRQLDELVGEDLFGLFAVDPIETRICMQWLSGFMEIPPRSLVALLLGYRGAPDPLPGKWCKNHDLWVAYRVGLWMWRNHAR